MIRVRNATPRDASPIARVHVETWRDSYAGILPSHKLAGMSRRQHVGGWSQSLRTPRREIVLVAEDAAGGILGFGTGGPARTFSPPYEGEIYMLYVLPGMNDTIRCDIAFGARLTALYWSSWLPSHETAPNF